MVEGAKGVQEVLSSDFKVTMLCATGEFMDRNQAQIEGKKIDTIIVDGKDLEQLGAFQSSSSAIAVARMRPNTKPVLDKGEFALVLDNVRDPGNLGTIIRTADWYGIRHIVASPETADLYNPKVISATMGSFTRINVYYTELADFIKNAGLPAYGTFLDGEDVHHTILGSGGLIIVGNESNGISPTIGSLVTKRITIPRWGKAESLNAAVATAIILDNIVRRR